MRLGGGEHFNKCKYPVGNRNLRKSFHLLYTLLHSDKPFHTNSHTTSHSIISYLISLFYSWSVHLIFLCWQFKLFDCLMKYKETFQSTARREQERVRNWRWVKMTNLWLMSMNEMERYKIVFTCAGGSVTLISISTAAYLRPFTVGTPSVQVTLVCFWTCK